MKPTTVYSVRFGSYSQAKFNESNNIMESQVWMRKIIHCSMQCIF